MGTVLDAKLEIFDANTDAICKKANQRLFFLRKLSSFNVDTTLVSMFYSAFTESVLSFSTICCFGSLSLKTRTNW